MQSSVLRGHPSVSEADFKLEKKIDDLLGKRGKTPDRIDSGNVGQKHGYCGWKLRSSLQIFCCDLFCKYADIFII